MVGFCMHCGASIPNEFIIKNGEVLPSPYVRCAYCNKMAGIKEHITEEDKDMELIERQGQIIIKDGKILPSES